ncbi:hypothetical protein L6164_001102 [Bauhinia variegata]|uniref:Uncharacterized protein n=1 Tax=Bauhinia variegata TaxID=167791 RepID=A0ACB9Q914_BAUVA|nr:hypothetical protein L6164_001102 [Bauhinia variegata]
MVISKMTTKAFVQNFQEPYIRSRENPFFDGLLRANNQTAFDTPRKVNSRDNAKSVSDIVDTEIRKLTSDISEEVLDLSLENSAGSSFTFDSFERISSDRWEITPFEQPAVDSELIDLGDPRDFEKASEEKEEFRGLELSAKTNFEKKYTVMKRKENLSNIPLPPSAATFYNGFSPEMEVVESCERIRKLNAYLRARKDDVISGVPGRFLHAVMSLDASDVGTVASTIMYAFYLNETLRCDQYCTIPIINIKRLNLGSHAELKWLLDSCQIDQSSLVFSDEIDLSYYDLYGSLKIVLLNGNGFSTKQEDCSCCTAIAEKFALHSPEILASKGISRLLLSGILFDTANLTAPQCTSKDKYMASLLINGAGRYGCNGLYKLLKFKVHDVSTLKVADILRKDFKKWTGEGFCAWKHDMEIALSAKNKLGFIDGEVSKPEHDQGLITAWNRCNHMVISWILNALSKEIADSVIYLSAAQEMWNELSERFEQANGAFIYQIQKELFSISQGTNTISTYYTRIKKVWDELKAFQAIPDFSCGTGKVLTKYLEDQKLFQFLMGLNDGSATVRGHISMTPSLPSVNQAYAMLIHEEKQKEIAAPLPVFSNDNAAMNDNTPKNNSMASQKTEQGKKSTITCNYCKTPGHTKDKCYKLHGYPANFKFQKPRKFPGVAQAENNENLPPVKPTSYSISQD